MRMVAVVLGGGTGQRIGAALPKQLLRLGGTTLVEHCVAAFEQAPGVDEILVVMAAGYVEQVRDMLAAGGFGKVSGVIAGGVARADSTRAALAAIAGDGSDCGVLLHDAARPLVDQRIIADCVAALAVHQAVGVAVPSPDTIAVTSDGVMTAMPRRDRIGAASTKPAVIPIPRSIARRETFSIRGAMMWFMAQAPVAATSTAVSIRW